MTTNTTDAGWSYQWLLDKYRDGNYRTRGWTLLMLADYIGANAVGSWAKDHVTGDWIINAHGRAKGDFRNSFPGAVVVVGKSDGTVAYVRLTERAGDSRHLWRFERIAAPTQKLDPYANRAKMEA